MEKKKAASGSGAHLVAAGILLSRISGLIRQRVFAHYFGNSDPGDAYYAALKIPNFLQNLFGEGVLSASFIPVYSNLLGNGNDEAADETALVVGSLLFLISSVLVALGILTTPWFIDLVAPGFSGEKRELTIRLVRILFPGTGLLVMSAWCLGILNSHRKFFLSYAAPVAWNGAIIAALLFYSDRNLDELAIYTAWGLVAGSALQFGVQLPVALRLLGRVRFKISLAGPVRLILRGLVPVIIARGVVQVSAYIDNVLASYLPAGSVSALAYAQAIYMLPISLFGMSVSAAELPTMSRAQGSTHEIATYLNTRVGGGLKQIAFFIVPSVVGCLWLGDVVVGVLYQSGHFSHADSLYVWGVLAGSTVGLLASTLGRLYSSTYYSLRDTRTPLNFALVRITLTTALGYLCGLKLPGWIGLDAKWGAAGLTASAGVAGWVEFLLLRRGIHRRIGKTTVGLKYLAQLWGVALLAAAVARGARELLGSAHPFWFGALVLGLFGILYLGGTAWLGIGQARRLAQRLGFKGAPGTK